MEDEKEQLHRRIDRMQKKVQHDEWKSGFSLIFNFFLHYPTLFVDLHVIPFQVENVRNYDKMLQAARSLRVEREKEQSLARQKLEQKNQVKIKHYPYYRSFFVRYSFWFLYVFVIFICICKFLVCIICY